MTTREQFGEQEWASVSALPGLVIMAACLSDGKMVPSVREIGAGAGALAEGAKSHPENAVLQELVAHETKPDLGESKPQDVSAAVEALVAEITEGVAVLRARVGTEEYAEIAGVLDAVAHAVVERIGTGFMGSGGTKVSESEQAFVDRLAAVLA